MSMRDLIIDIQDEIAREVLSFPEIARKYEVPLSWVNEAWDMLCEQENHEAELAAWHRELEAERSAGYSHDELERDHDEAYEPDYADSWYEDQYDLDSQAF